MLHIWTTWWTFDKDYWVWKWIYDVGIWRPIIWDILKKCVYEWDYEITELMRKDSLDMTDKDRKKIADYVLEREWEFLITHWTDTMLKSAETIKQLWDIANKTVILLWVAQPYSMKKTDADFNVWVWIWSLNMLRETWRPWIYICMNGQTFNSSEVEKCDDGVFRKK